MSAARYRVEHTTHYRYASAALASQQLLRLTPRGCHWQRLVAHRIDVDPQPAERVAQVDAHGNRIERIVLLAPHTELYVHADSTVEVSPHAPRADAASSPWEEVHALLRAGRTPAVLEAAAYAWASPLVAIDGRLAAWAAADFTPGRPLLEAAIALSGRIHGEFEFDPQATTIATPVGEVLERRRGVCQDFAHLAIACLRSRGLAARYVSGYLLTSPPPGRPRLVGADASHAWISVYVPDLGWVDLDPTNDLLPDTEHITLGWGRDFADVSPLRGVITGGGAQGLEVRVTVTPAGEYDARG